MYYAEDVPAYLIDSEAEKPWRDEDLGMSATQIVAKSESADDARDAMFDHLWDIADMDHTVRSQKSSLYRIAAVLINSGADGVRIGGRYYRIREVS